jgi:hypothetical protein
MFFAQRRPGFREKTFRRKIYQNRKEVNPEAQQINVAASISHSGHE